MAAEYDPSEFVDEDLPGARKAFASTSPALAGGAAAMAQRAPTREEVEGKVGEMQTKLAELRRQQQELERERSGLEELRRRQNEFAAGRPEMVQHLTRGIALLEEAEFNTRREAEQMAKALAGLREALDKVQAIHEETWTADALEVELTRALTAIENARMEWNSARLKFPFLSGEGGATTPAASAASPVEALFEQRHYAELCKLGLALTWPLLLAGLAIFIALLMK